MPAVVVGELPTGQRLRRYGIYTFESDMLGCATEHDIYDNNRQ